jgi:hypothetical protein
LFSFFRNSEDLAREVYVEVNYLTKLYGDDAGRIALEKAQRPRLRTLRRRVLQEAARQLANAQERKHQSTSDHEPTPPPSKVYSIDDNAHFRLTEPIDRWTLVEPEFAPAPAFPPALAAAESAPFRLSESQDDWTGVEPEMAAAPFIATMDVPRLNSPDHEVCLSMVAPEPEPEPQPEAQAEPEPIPAPAEVQLLGSVQSEAASPLAPVPEPVEPPAPVRKAKRVVVSRATTFGIELEIDGVLVMFDARADAKVVSALVYALRDS